MLFGQATFCARQWWQKTFGFINQLLVLGNLLGSDNRVLGHLDANGIFQQSFLNTYLGQGCSLCPHIMEAQHCSCSVLRMAKNLAWQQMLPLQQVVGFQFLDHFLELLINGLVGVQDVIHILDHSRWHSHGLGKSKMLEICKNGFCICFNSKSLGKWKQPKAERIHWLCGEQISKWPYGF